MTRGQAFSGLIEKGYVHAVLAGNALATHDLEAAYLGTALGQNIYTQESQPNGHYNHLDTINRVRACGSIPAFLQEEHIQDGIIYTLEKKGVPYVLAGSIRDDGPLPPVYGNVYAAQDAMAQPGTHSHHGDLHGHGAAHHCHGEHDALLSRTG